MQAAGNKCQVTLKTLCIHPIRNLNQISKNTINALNKSEIILKAY